MTHLTFAKAIDLHQWAERLDARPMLPQIVRRLVHASAIGLRRVDFPAGEGIQDPGWDGIVEAERAGPFVPGGVSGWELGTGSDPRSKAGEDYEKRTRDPLGIDPGHSTFVFVTPRRWSGKQEWVRERLAEGKWRDVRAYDAGDLEQWLETLPAVHLWVSRLIGKQPHGVLDLEFWWSSWSRMTNPAMSTSLVLCGRDETAERVHGWLADSSQYLTLAADSRDEALAVFAAAVQKLPDRDRERHLASIVVVEEVSAWRELSSAGHPLVLVPLVQDLERVGGAPPPGIRVLVPAGRSESVDKDAELVPRLDRSELARVFEAEGLDHHRAWELAGLARRSLAAFRRKRGATSLDARPAWARADEGRCLVPALFLGAWDASRDGDRRAIGILCAEPCDAWLAALVRWPNESDPPLRRGGDQWYLASKEDAWTLLSGLVESRDLARFETVALDVLGELDPRFELPEGEQWMADAVGRVPSCSGPLRQEIADTLAFLGAQGQQPFAHAEGSGSMLAKRIVRKLLERAGADWRAWASLAGLLPLLAEAAPDELCAALEEGLHGDDPVLRKLFREQSSNPFDSSPHVGLLWALETLAWSPDHLSRAALVLAGLVSVDPGGTLANRPLASLRSIFLLWHPETSVDLDRRVQVLDDLRKKFPELTWRVLCRLVPESNEGGGMTAKPRWRDWVPEGPRRTSPRELRRGVIAIVERLLADVGESGERWGTFIELLPRMPDEQHQAVIRCLMCMDLESVSAQTRVIVWNGLRDLVGKHRSFPDAWWAMDAERVEQLAATYTRFEPTDVIERHAWLFGRDPKLVQGRASDWEAHEAAVESARVEALRVLLEEDGIPQLIQLVHRIEDPGAAGRVLGKSALVVAEEGELLREAACSGVRSLETFVAEFVWGRTRNRGLAWVESKLCGVARDWPAQKRVLLLLPLRPEPQTWELLVGVGDELRDEYWRHVNPSQVLDADLQHASEELLARDRPFAAASLWGFRTSAAGKPPPALALRILESAARGSAEHESLHQVLEHALPELLGALYGAEEVEEPRIAALEWTFLPILVRSKLKPRVLYRELARNPELFAEIIGFVYPAEGGEPRETTQAELARTRHGDELLRAWRIVPGTNDEGIDADALLVWVERARFALAASGRARRGDVKIGELLSGAPEGLDAAWPHLAVRTVIEEVRSEDLERGIWIGVFKARGVQFRDPYGGGATELALAERYRADATKLADEFPRTAAMLQRFADSEAHAAQREDRDSDLRADLG